MGIQRAEVERVLESVGFGGEMRGAAISSLSGGWKMKLALGAGRKLALTHADQTRCLLVCSCCLLVRGQKRLTHEARRLGCNQFTCCEQ